MARGPMPITPSVIRSEGAALPSAPRAAAGTNHGSAITAPAAMERCSTSRRVNFSILFSMACLPSSKSSGKAPSPAAISNRLLMVKDPGVLLCRPLYPRVQSQCNRRRSSSPRPWQDKANGGHFVDGHREPAWKGPRDWHASFRQVLTNPDFYRGSRPPVGLISLGRGFRLRAYPRTALGGEKLPKSPRLRKFSDRL